MKEQEVFNLTAHRELWNWLAENPTKNKGDWKGWKRNGGKYGKAIADCFACDIVRSACDLCPLEWTSNSDGEAVCDGEGGLWREWKYEEDLEKRSQLALQIANLPVIDGIEYI